MITSTSIAAAPALLALTFGPAFFGALVVGAVVLAAIGVMTLAALLVADIRNRRTW